MMTSMNIPASALAVALLAVLGSPAWAKETDTTRATASPPVINASEDTPITYPGGTPPAPVSGALDADDSTYDRQVSDCGGFSKSGVGVRYDTITVTNTGASAATFNVAIQCGDGDGFLSAYSAFDPSNSATGCVASNDDFDKNLCPTLNGISIPAGQTMVFVVSEFETGSADAWTADFTGTTPVSLQNFKIE